MLLNIAIYTLLVVAPVTQATSTHIYEKCFTSWGPYSRAHISTSTCTETLTFKATKTVTHSQTILITPHARTSTKFTTKEFLVQTTSTITSLVTSTVSTPVGFVPFTSLPTFPPVEEKRLARLAKKELEPKRWNSHPQKVDCEKIVKIYYTVTTTLVHKKTSTLPIHTIEITKTKTTTKTSTGVTTTDESVATVYAACQPDNLVFRDRVVAIFAVESDSFIQTPPAASALECCILCQTSRDNCGASYFTQNQCNLVIVNTCIIGGNGPRAAGVTLENRGRDSGVFSDGPCGQFIIQDDDT